MGGGRGDCAPVESSDETLFESIPTAFIGSTRFERFASSFLVFSPRSFFFLCVSRSLWWRFVAFSIEWPPAPMVVLLLFVAGAPHVRAHYAAVVGNGFDWALLGFTGFFFLGLAPLLTPHSISTLNSVLSSSSACNWLLLGYTELYWVILGYTWLYLVLLGFTGFYWVFLWDVWLLSKLGLALLMTLQ